MLYRPKRGEKDGDIRVQATHGPDIVGERGGGVNVEAEGEGSEMQRYALGARDLSRSKDHDEG